MVYDFFDSPLGPMIMVADNQGLRYLEFQQGKSPVTIEDDWRQDAQPFTELKQQLSEYFAGERKTFDIPLAPQGTAFQQAVWSLLQRIPYGDVTHYGAMAEKLGNPKAMRAVGAANGKNPICIIIPCHRVIGKSGNLTGYAGGLDIKQKLLAIETQPSLL